MGEAKRTWQEPSDVAKCTSPSVFISECSHAGKGGGRGGKTGIAGVKRGADALFQKDWENATEPSEAALSDASAFPATTEASARCEPSDFVTHHPTNPAPLPAPHLSPPHPYRIYLTYKHSCRLALSPSWCNQLA